MRRRPQLLIGLTLGLLLATLVGAASAQQGPGGAAAAPSGVGHPPLVNELLLGLVVILIGAKLGGALFERLGQPPVLGELLFGIAAGNLGLVGFHGLEPVARNAAILALSELGVILLLFEVGLESNMQEMRRVGLSSLLVAFLGVTVPVVLGVVVGRAFLPNEHPLAHLFIGATLCATSVGITARVLKDLGQLHRPEARIVLGAAVLDDVMGLVLLAVISGLISASASGASVDLVGMFLIVARSLGFLVAAVALGTFLSPRLFRLASYLNVRHMLLVTSLGFCFLLARLAAEIQLAPIVGAFAAGLILDPVHYRDFSDRGEHTIEELIHPISGFLVPIFFVVTGMNVDLAAVSRPESLGFAAVLTFAAILGKQVCGLGVLQRNVDRLSVGIGMVPRGEVGLIFANIGLTLHLPGAGGSTTPVVSDATFSAVVLMVLTTTLITPPLLKWSLSRGSEAAASGGPGPEE